MLQNADHADLRGATLNDIAGNQFNTFVFSPEEREALATLKPAAREGYDVPRCMEGTRQSVLEKIYSWLDDFMTEKETLTTPNILWISGSPGAGKSAIASTLVSELAKRRRLGASFFFKRGDASLGDPSNVWRTVASDLARFHPDVKASIVEFLRRPGYRDADIRLHFDCLIEEPLTNNCEKLSAAPPVVVLDALDECGSVDTSFQRHILLDTLIRWSRLPQSTKLIVTSRDERLPGSFRDERVCRHIALKTGDSVSSETGNDIRTFFEKSFDRIRPTLGMLSPWPGILAIDQLTERAAGLFIWAKTAMAFMEEEENGAPDSRLRRVLGGKMGQGTDNIDLLYRQILSFNFRKSSDTMLGLFRDVVGTITIAKTPLHRGDLKYFLGRLTAEDERQFNIILHCLSSVISVGEADDGLLYLRHLSFAEFLSDANRCRDCRFFVDLSKQCRDQTLTCFRIMKAELKFNICDLETSHVPNDAIEDLSMRIVATIPFRLSYSCRFWAAHLGDTTIKDARDVLLQGLEQFLYVRLLYWLEVMSLIEEIPAALIALLTVARLIKPFAVDLSNFARDASRFVANFHIPISTSAPHIYLSALPFSPEQSMISKQFISQFPQTLSVATGRENQWPALLNVLIGHGSVVNSVGFSPDGKWVVSGSSDHTVRIWDVETGQIVAGPLGGHMDEVMSVGFSPNGKWVVSGSSDKMVRIWDVETGQIVAGPFEGHSGAVDSVGFSPDGKWVVSGSWDETVCIWHAKTGQIAAGPFEGHSDGVSSVGFSPDGKWVVSGSRDTKVRIWDVETGEIVAGPFEGHSDSVHSVGFSPNGKWVVSGSRDRTVRIWDVETGEIAAGPFEGHSDSVHSVGFSPNGKWVVSGSWDRTVRIWDVETGEIAAGPFEGHSDVVMSVGFSPDGKWVVSGSWDKTVRIWNVETGQIVAGLNEGHMERVRTVGFSPDGKWVVSGSWDKTVRIWDVETGQTAAGPFEGHSGAVDSVGFSPDGKWVVSGSSDKTVRIWHAKTGQVAAGPFEGHSIDVMSVGFSPDGKWVVSGSWDKTVRIWDVETGQTAAGPFEGHSDGVYSVGFSPNGKWVVSGSWDETVRIWDVETGEIVAGPFEGHSGPVHSVGFSPDGKWVVSGSWDKTVRIWDVETGQIVAGPFEGHLGNVWSVGFSPDGKWVVSGSEDNTVRIWDVETGKIAAGPFQGHSDVVMSVGFSPDGKWVVSGSWDKTVRIWDVETAQIVAGPFCHQIGRSSFGFSSGGMQVVSGSEDSDRLPNFREMTSISGTSHTATLVSIGGSNAFQSCRTMDWALLSDSNGAKFSGLLRPLLFWVPPEYRKGLCDAETHAILGGRITRLDLSRFVHGTSWTQCHPHPCTEIGRPLPSPVPVDNSCSLWSIFQVNRDSFQGIFINNLSSLWFAFVVMPFIAVYYYYSFISDK